MVHCGFESLAKIVGQRWKELPPDELEIYKKRAEDDMKRYRKEMEAYVQKQREGLEQSREHLEKLVDEETKKRSQRISTRYYPPMSAHAHG